LAETEEAAGFVPESLKCNLCDELRNFNLENDKQDEHKKYPLANTEVCERNLDRFPQVQAFVKEDMTSQWGARVGVRHVRGVRPQVQTLNIEKWDTNTIDFLNEVIE
uniref:Selenoprotein F n=1 Tax=Heligmosomoides polygyrus TaxID=6339 RepID=A0A183GQD6_HELPZ